jgi:ATP-dependent protease ClpP protease subunit
MVTRCSTFALLLFVAFSHPALAAKVLWKTDDCGLGPDVKCWEMRIDGEIDDQTVKDIAAALQAGKKASGVRVEINSPGGDVASALAIGRMFRRATMPLIVEQNDVCLSACVFVLAGATSRFIDGKVGVHRLYSGIPKTAVKRGEVMDSYTTLNAQVRVYLTEMNVSERLVEEMQRVPPDRIRYLTKIEMDRYGLIEEDPAYREAIDLEEAQKHGITDRAEFMRRRRRANIECNVIIDQSDQLACYNAVLDGKR